MDVTSVQAYLYAGSVPTLTASGEQEIEITKYLMSTDNKERIPHDRYLWY